jgi:hypothetical protein
VSTPLTDARQILPGTVKRDVAGRSVLRMSGSLLQTFARGAGRFLVPLLLVAAALGTVWTVTAAHSEVFSPRDEWVYLDYLNKLPQQGFIHQGEVVGPDPRARMACFGVRDYGPMGPPCGSDYSDLAAFPQQAINTADIYTPLYFVVTRVAAGGIQLVTGQDLFHSARLTGGLWLAASMLLFYGMMRSFRVSRGAILGLGLAFIGSPLAWWTYTYISTDAPTFLIGVAGLWIAHTFLRGNTPAWAVVAFSVGAVLFKTTNLLSVALIAFYLLLEVARKRWRSKTESGRRTWPRGAELKTLIVAAASVVFGGLAQVSWLAVRALTAVGPSPDQGNLSSFGPGEMGRLALMTIPDTIISNSTINPSGANSYQIPEFIVLPLSWICIIAVVGSFWNLRSRSEQAPLVTAIAFAAVVFVPALAFALAHSQGVYYPLPARYGAPLMASILLVGGFALKNRWARGAVIGYGAALVIYVILQAPILA